jgi:adenine/guanine phosphoribosyltransferase-like PRPP-binding protein
MTVWTGGFVSEAVGISVQTDRSRSLVPVESLVGLAVRDNPKRAQLLVSTVLAKHVPTVPSAALAAGALLGALVRAELTGVAPDAAPFAEFSRLLAARRPLGPEERAALRSLLDALAAAPSASAGPVADPSGGRVVTIGYAETATGLGHLVADAIGAPYVHSTRHDVPGAAFTAFEEEHSHASDHRLYVQPGWLASGGTTVLVDDELSTGRTIRNTIAALHARAPQEHWVVAALIDLRPAADRALMESLAAELGTRISVVALGTGGITLPDDVLARARTLIDTLAASGGAAAAAVLGAPAAGAHDGAGVDAMAYAPGEGAGAHTPGELTVLEPGIAGVRSARFGAEGALDREAATAIARDVLGALPAVAPPGDASDGALESATGGVLVLGSEEHIALPLAVAEELDRARGDVLFSTSTRSPIAVLDRPDYAIASAIRYRSHDRTLDGPGPRFAYNLTRGGGRFDAVVLLPEPGVHPEALFAAAGLVESLRTVTDHVIVALLPEAARASGPSPDHAAPASPTASVPPTAADTSPTRATERNRTA